MVWRGTACLGWLDRGTPDRERVQTCVQRILVDDERATQIVRRIRMPLRSVMGDEQEWAWPRRGTGGTRDQVAHVLSDGCVLRDHVAIHGFLIVQGRATCLREQSHKP